MPISADALRGIPTESVRAWNALNHADRTVALVIIAVVVIRFAVVPLVSAWRRNNG